MRYLLISACFVGSLLIDSAVLAQEEGAPGQPKIIPDNKYGEGGTKERTWFVPFGSDTNPNAKIRIREKWKDKDGKTRETYSTEGDGVSWEFFEDGNSSETVSIRWLGSRVSVYLRGQIIGEPRDHCSSDGVHGLIEDVEKQFAKNGTIARDLLEKEVDSKLAQEKPKEGDNQVEQPDLDKQRRVFVGAEEAKADAQKRAEVKARCDGIREKIRTLQDLLRKSQKEPASPQQDLETIRKQIDDLLSQLADCPKQEPIDAQFDCLKSKFPDVVRTFATTLAYDVTNKREFEWDGQAWIAKDTKESICPPGGIDPCLVGTWECTSFKEANKFITGGGTGFRVTFKSDGTETVDYSKMQPIRAGGDKMVYEGKATARISAKDGVAKIENMIDAAAKFNASFLAKRYGKEWNPKLPELGPGGLGTTKGKNNYKCTGDSLVYQSSTPRGEADCTVTLRKCTQEAQKDQDQPKLPPNEDSKKTGGQDGKTFDEAAYDKDMKELRSRVQKHECEGLQSEIRQLQDSLVAMGEKTASWQHGLSHSDQIISSLKADIKKAQEKEDEEQRGKWLDLLNSELSYRDSINAKISGMQSEREQVRKKIDDLLSKLADCKSKP